jgi:hypothetical protein
MRTGTSDKRLLSGGGRVSFAVLAAIFAVLAAIFAVLAAILVVPQVVSSARTEASSARHVVGRGVRRAVHVYANERSGVDDPIAVAFSPMSGLMYLASRVSGQSGTVLGMTELDTAVRGHDTIDLSVDVADGVNLAFDARFGRLLVIEHPGNIITSVSEGDEEGLDPSTIKRMRIAGWSVGDPEGITVTPNGTVYVLDAATRQITRLDPDEGGSLHPAATSIDLAALGVKGAHGLAFDPSTGHLHVFDRQAHALVELTTDGQVVDTRTLSDLGVADAASISFAPTADTTDADTRQGLFIVGAQSMQSTTQVLSEVSLQAAAAPQGTMIASSLLHRTDTALWDPPSPDPSGLAYIAASNKLMIVDGEVEETVNGITHFQGANEWDTTLAGTVTRTANISKIVPTVTPMTNEPTDIAYDPVANRYFVSDDDALRVYTLYPGADNLFGTADDTWTVFSTGTYGNGDPEGITFDTWHQHIFVSDGVNDEIYEYTLDGALVQHFDVERYGVSDPEGVDFNTASGTLVVLSNIGNPIAVETTLAGGLLRTVDLSAMGPVAPAGLVVAPASDGSGAPSYYVVDRGIDNNSNPNIIDGFMAEMSAPPTLPAGFNTPPVVDAGADAAVDLPNTGSLHGVVTDDGQPSNTMTYSWTTDSGPGNVVFGNATALDTTASFDTPGTYILRLTASDGQLSGDDTVTLTVTGIGTGSIFDTAVSTSTDDAEESSTGGMTMGSSDLELVYDGSNQVVGIRFNGIPIPTGVAIESAYLQFTTDEVQNETTNLVIRGQAADNAATFASTNFAVSSRPRTTASIAWAPAPWMALGEAGADQRTPDLAPVVQEIVNRTGWASGNSLAFIITGTGHRTAHAFDFGTGAPKLHIVYGPTPANTAPVVDAGPDVSVNMPSAVTLAGTVTDDGLPQPASLTWSTVSGPGTVNFANASAASTTASFSAAGTYVLQLAASDGEFSSSDDVTVTVNPATDLIFADGFETGDLSAWSSTVAPSKLSVSNGAPLYGTYSLRVAVNDNNPGYVVDATPVAEARYRARFQFDLAGLTMAQNDLHRIFSVVTSTGVEVGRVEVRFSAQNQYQVRISAQDDQAVAINSNWIAITTGKRTVEIDWQASSAPGANSGNMTLWIDGTQRATLTSIDSDLQRIEATHLGAVQGIDTGTRGTYVFDAFESRRNTYIGAPV